jgi:phage portal protein BeeE
MSRRGPVTRLLDRLRKGAARLLLKSAGEARLAEMIGGWRFGGYPGTWTGDRVEQVRHYKHWVYRAVDSIARMVATEPPCVGRVTSTADRKSHAARGKALPPRHFLDAAGRKKALTALRPQDEIEYVENAHPLAELLRDPNEPDTGGDLWRELDLFLELTGNGYLWPVPNGAGRICELWVIPSHWVYPVSEGKRRLIDYYEVRPYEMFGGSPVTSVARYDADELIHFRYKSPMSKVDGFAPLQAGAEMVDVYESIQMARFFACKQGANVGAAIVLGEDYDVEGDNDIRRIEAKWFQRHQGERGFERPMILPAGSTLIHPPSERELAYLQSADQMRDYVLAMWGVPKTVAGITEAVNRATFVGSMAAFIYQTVNPRLRYLGDVLSEKLAACFGDDLRVWWPDMTPADPESDRADCDMLARNCAITPNELRARYGYEPWPNGGDDPIAPMGVAPMPLNTGESLDLGGAPGLTGGRREAADDDADGLGDDGGLTIGGEPKE